jgi:FADH2 O2-dependent halogenase
MSPKIKQYDVAIIGSGMGGSMLGAILARNGVDVLLLDGGTHPRFAVGEATIPYTSVIQRVLAARYNLPELKALTALVHTAKAIGPTFGIKTHFGFLRHEPGKPQDPQEVNQFHTPGLLHEAHHLYRQDSDAWVFHLAVQSGCTPRQGFRVADVDFDDRGVTLAGVDGDEYRARYVVDASGFRSPLADKFGVREDPPRFKHHSRSMWTHMLGVTHTDDLFAHRAPSDKPPHPWYGGTVHHMFERGWFWVIGFDNTPLSNNPLCSVGLTLDPRLYPKDPSKTPMEEFMEHASRYPDIERQYAGGVPVREWISTERLQYGSKQTVGDRWCLLSHAGAFIDPLFSYGLANTGDAVNALAWRLMRAVKDDDFSADRFEYIERLQQRLFDYNDEIVNAGFTGFSHFGLWKAIFRIWVWGSNAGTLRLQEALTKFHKKPDDRLFTDLEEVPYLGFDWPVHEGYKHLFDEMVRNCDAYQAGDITADDAADALWDEIQACNFMGKPIGFCNRSVRFMSPTPLTIARGVKWAQTEADPETRRLLVGAVREGVKHKLRGDRIF